MRLLKPLIEKPMKIFDDTLADLSPATSQERIAKVRDEVGDEYLSYLDKAIQNTLYTIPACDYGKSDQLILGTATKGDFVAQYDTGMVGSAAAGRQHYDRIRALALFNKCPYCGIGDVATLDHYLSKSRYPVYSVMSANLIPCCSDCNKVKGGGVISEGSQTLHPYFEKPIIDQTSWLVASVSEKHPRIAKFRVDIPVHWPADLARRTINHFEELELARRYSIQAAVELGSTSEYLMDLTEFDSRRSHLRRMARVEDGIHRNSWKAALYRELAHLDWYALEGYLRP
ncbi:HNH endonuclease [Massilia sp. HP4]|uniref:HNH endonuclease n=1 Tax=Massilia sp. HP4 TaxID=2562316 RepID=UPI0014852850|nr:HNH endonuclease signature motif containing protein [Massilia sp. HP4]